jgi:enoyl-CoA hydratase
MGIEDDSLVEVEDRGPVRWMWFNRARVHNAQNAALLRRLDAVLIDTERNSGVRAVVLGGRGPSFSAGHDLGEIAFNEEYRRRASTVEGRMWQELELFVRPAQRFRELPVPTICRVQGHCLAASLMFVCGADFVVAAEDATFGSNVSTTIGTADVELPTLMGRLDDQLAKRMLWLGETLTGVEAVRCGLAQWAVPADDLDSAVENVIRRLLDVPREALALSKLSFRFVADQRGAADAAAYHFLAHQLSHHTSDAVALQQQRVQDLQAREEGRQTDAAGESD